MRFRSQLQKTRPHLTIPRVAVVLILLAGLTAVLHLHGAGTPAAPEKLAALELRTLDGERLRLEELRGKPVLLSFWSTSCGICIQEMPEMNRLDQALDAKGARLLSIAMPYDPPNLVLETAQALNIEFPVAIDLDGAITTAFAVPGTPYKVLLAGDGSVARTFIGKLDYDKTLESVTSLQ